MKKHLLYLSITTFVTFLIISFCQSAGAANSAGPLGKIFASKADTGRMPKRPRLKKARKLSKDVDADAHEDGVDADIKARGHQEFLKIKDPHTNTVPIERLINARRQRDQFMNNVIVRHQSIIPKKSGNAPGAPVTPQLALSALQWHERGPTNVGGRTRALIFDLNDAAHGYKKVFAGGVGGGLWYTNDITATPVQWHKINDFFDNIAISCIAQDPVNPQVIYAGTGEGYLNADAISGLGVWKSTDGGATWANLPSTTGFKLINSILVDKNESVYIAGETDTFVGFGVEKSANGGSTWTNVITSSEAGGDLQLAANGDVYATTGVIFLTGHIYMSDFRVNGANTGNAGTWTNITPATNGVITPSTTSWYRIKLACAPSDSNIVYALFETSANGNYNVTSVQQYNKSANTWTVKTVPGTSFANGQGWYSIAAAVDPNNPNVLYAGSLDASKSIDGGSTWAHETTWYLDPSSPQFVHADHHAYTYAPGSSTRLLMGTDGGIFYSTNPDGTPSFVNKNNGYDVTQFYSVALHPTNYNYAIGGTQDNATQVFTSAGLAPTTSVIGGDGAFSFIDQLSPNIQIGSYVYDQYYLSTDNGATFNGLGSYGYGSFINPTDYDDVKKNLYAGSYQGYYFRIANVLSPAYNLVQVSGFGGANITAVTVAPKTAGRVYFGLDNGTVVVVDSAQNGTSNTGRVLNPNAGVKATVSCVAVDTLTEDHLLVTYSNYGVTHIYETKNATAASPVWTAVDGNLPDMPVRWSILFPGDATRAIIATELGVWTTDQLNGSSTVWDPTNTGLANTEVDMLKYRPADRTLAAATHGRGLFTTTLPSNSTNAVLSNLTISSGTLAPAFDPGTTSYTDGVANTVTSITVTATVSAPGATIKINGTTVASGAPSAAIPLTVGANSINVVVTASDQVTTRTYHTTITRAGSSVATLAKIATNTGIALTSVTGPDFKDFTLTVPFTTSSIVITPTADDPTETIKVNGVTVASGSPSAAIALPVGVTKVNTVVTAQDGVTVKTYGITVTRKANNNALLSKLSTNSGVALTQVTGADYRDYTLSLPNTTTSITITPTLQDVNATVKVNGQTVASGSASAAIPLPVGTTTINTVITAQDGVTTNTYSIAVKRAGSSNALLAKLSTNTGIALTQVTGPDYKDYTLSVPNSRNSIIITPTAADTTAIIKVNGVIVVSGSPSAAIPLPAGLTTINTVVTAQDGTTIKTYSIAVIRAKSSNAGLAALITGDGAVSPAFSTGTTSYTLAVANTVTSITITPTATDTTATIKVNGTAVLTGRASGAIALAVGPNTINTVVTAQDGTTTKTYKLVVTRAASNNALLTTIKTTPTETLTSVTGPSFKNFTTSVPNAQASLQITAVTQDAGATIKINGTTVASNTLSPAIALGAGITNINTVVTAADGVTTNTYTIAVTRQSDNALLGSIKTTPLETLTSVTPSGGSYRNYTATVPGSQASIQITATPQDAGASIKINGTAVANGTLSPAIALTTGPNVINTVITSSDGTTSKTYTITVTRPSTNAFLTKLSTNSGVALTTVTGPDYKDYAISVPNATASITLTPITQDATATVKVSGTTVASGTASAPIPLQVGSNTINTVVTAQDGTTSNTYGLTVTRAAMMALYAPIDTLTADGLTIHPGVTPNGDGKDDIFTIDGVNAYPDNKVTIMTRGGAVVYEATGYDNQTKFFDGHSNKNGTMQLPGTYFYSLEYKADGKTKVKTGFLVLKY